MDLARPLRVGRPMEAPHADRRECSLKLNPFDPLRKAFKHLLDPYRLPQGAVATLAPIFALSTVLLVHQAVTVMLFVYVVLRLR